MYVKCSIKASFAILLVELCPRSSSLSFLLQVFDLYGIGLRQAFSTPNLLRTLNLKVLIVH